MKRNFFILWFFTSLLMSVPVLLLYNSEMKAEMVRIEAKEQNMISRVVSSISADLGHTSAELIFLSKLHEFMEMLNSSDNFSVKELLSDYHSLMMQTKNYDQIRYINEKGKEIIRINYNNGQPEVVSKSELQSKANRYYFKDIMSLDRGEIFVSPFDLNIEHKELERPYKPVVRFGMPVFDSFGTKRGILILNYIASHMITHIKEISSDDEREFMLLNSDGYWLVAPNPEDEWGFMLEARKEKRFSNTYPDAWRQISQAKSGQFYHEKSLFTFDTIYPVKGHHKSSTGSSDANGPSKATVHAKDYYWKTVYRMPPDILYKHVGIMHIKFSGFYLLLAIIIAAGSWVVARANHRRMSIEMALKESEERSRAIVKTAGEGIIAIGTDSRIIFVNEEFTRIFEYPENELIGMKIEMLMPDEYREKHSKGMTRYLQSGEARVLGKRLELEGLTKSGRAFPLEMRIEETERETIKQRIFIASMRDITERKQIEEESRKYAEELESSNRIKDLFTDIMRHDLLNPAHVILNSAEILHNEEKEDRKLQMLDLIRESSAEFVELIENASTYSHIKDLEEIDSDLHDLGEIIEKVVHDLDFDLKEKRMSLAFNRDRTYPAQVNILVREVFYNLISNAIKYGMEETEIIVKIEESGEDWLVSVMDEGEGISDENKERIFERFERAVATSVKGTGLGLAIAKRIVELHMGKIWVEDSAGSGSIFYVKLPKK